MANHLKAERKRPILNALCEGCSARSVTRLVGIHLETVLKLLVKSGEHCEAILDRELRDVFTSSVQCDEFWSFVAKKERKLEPGDPSEWGDAYTFLGLERESKLILASHVGKRDDANTDRFVEVLSRRVGGEVQIFTDEWGAYRSSIPRHFGARAHFAQVIKHFDGDTAESHRYSPRRLRELRNTAYAVFQRLGWYPLRMLNLVDHST